MEAHEHTMSDAVASRERDLDLLFLAAEGGLPGTDDGNESLSGLGVDPDNVDESAQEALYNYALEVSTSTVLTVTLAVGGPTQYMSAEIDRDTHGCWVRETPVTFFDSWAVPQETRLANDSAMTRLFDQYVETYSPES